VWKLFLIANASSHRMLLSRLPDYYAGTNAEKKIRIIVLIKQIKTDIKKTTLSTIMHEHKLISTVIIASWKRGK
jgi:hypothetical protein